MAQRDCLEFAAATVAQHPGIVLELGLGNGRTFDHLRQIMPDREIFVFDRQVAAHPSCIPDDDHMILGDFSETLPAAVSRFEGQCILVHCDIGTGINERDSRMAAFLSDVLHPALAGHGLVVSDQKMEMPDCEIVELPPEVPPDRYFLLQRRAV